MKTKYFITILLNWETNKWFLFVILKGYAIPNIYPMIFCSICFLRSLEAFSLQHVDSNMPQDPSITDRISLGWQKHWPVFCCWSENGLRSLYVLGSRPSEVSEDTLHFSVVCTEMERVYINFRSPISGNVQKMSTILRPKM